jgi:hypothetical protein
VARKWPRLQSKDFSAACFDALVKRWDKCINVGQRSKCFFLVRKSHVLHFVSIFDLFTDSLVFYFDGELSYKVLRKILGPNKDEGSWPFAV